MSGTGSLQHVNFTVNAPRITGISPTSGAVGTSVTINGSGFQSPMGNGQITFGNSIPAASIVSWSDTQIVATVPAQATTGAVSVRASNSVFSNQDVVFTMANPVVTGLSPNTGPTGTQVQISGTGFGAAQGGSVVTFNHVAATVTNWSDTQIVAVAPAGAASGPVQITEGGVVSSPNIYFRRTDADYRPAGAHHDSRLHPCGKRSSPAREGGIIGTSITAKNISSPVTTYLWIHANRSSPKRPKSSMVDPRTPVGTTWIDEFGRHWVVDKPGHIAPLNPGETPFGPFPMPVNPIVSEYADNYN